LFLSRPKLFKEATMKKIRKGDSVIVLTGRDKGKKALLPAFLKTSLLLRV
jgi:hypothetical protein